AAAAGLVLLVGREPPAEGNAQRRHPGGPLPPRQHLDADLVEPGPRGRDRVLARRPGRRDAAAPVAAPAALVGLELGVVEAAPQERHAAALGALVGEHRLLLGQPGLLDALVALAVVGPGLTRARPAAADPAYRAVDVEHLEHHLQAG